MDLFPFALDTAMAEHIDWNAVSAISNVAMTVATFAAVFVALFSSRIESRRVIKVRFYSNTFLASSVTGEIGASFVSIDVTNACMRDIEVLGWGFSVGGKKGFWQVVDPVQPLLGKSLPYRLAPDECVSLFYARDDFQSFLRKLLSEDGFSPRAKLYVFVKYGPGKMKLTRTGARIADLLDGAEG